MLAENRPVVRWWAVIGIGITVVVVVTSLAALSGNGHEADARTAAFWQNSIEKHLELSHQVLKHNQDIAATAKQLVEADAQARKEFIRLQEKIQDERGALVKMYEALETEKRQIAMERQRDPIIAAAMTEMAFLLAVCISLVFCWVLLYRMSADSDEALVRDLLLQDLTARRSRILPPPPPPPALTHDKPKAIANKKT